MFSFHSQGLTREETAMLAKTAEAHEPKYGHMFDHIAAAMALIAVVVFALAWPSANVGLSIAAASLMVLAVVLVVVGRLLHRTNGNTPSRIQPPFR